MLIATGHHIKERGEMMTELLDRHHALFRWVAEFLLMPLHWLAVGLHQHSTATAIGSAVLVFYATTAVRHARKYGVTRHD